MAKNKRIHVATNESKQTGERIRTLRTNLGLTQRVLGKKALVSANHISSVERGVENISDDAISRIATALETSYEFLKSGNIVALKKDTKKRNSMRERRCAQCKGQMSLEDFGIA